TSGPIGSRIGPGEKKILRTSASGTVQNPPNGASAFWSPAIALFLTTGSRDSCSSSRRSAAVRPAACRRRRTPDACCSACSIRPVSQRVWYRRRSDADSVSLAWSQNPRRRSPAFTGSLADDVGLHGPQRAQQRGLGPGGHVVLVEGLDQRLHGGAPLA